MNGRFGGQGWEMEVMQDTRKQKTFERGEDTGMGSAGIARTVHVTHKDALHSALSTEKQVQ